MRKYCQFFVPIWVDPTGICGKPAVDEVHGMFMCAEHYDLSQQPLESACQQVVDPEAIERPFPVGPVKQAGGSNVS
jgi:hypothetical protein